MQIGHPSSAPSGAWILGGILVLGIIVIAVPLIFLVTTRVTAAFPTTGLTADEKGNLSAMEATGASALSLTSIVEFVLGASIILGALFLLFSMRQG